MKTFSALAHSLFEATILAKGLSGCVEIVAGILFLFGRKETIHQIIIYIADQSLASISSHASNYLTYQASTFSSSTQNFIAAYFLFYGLINIFLVVCLTYKRLWAYPVAIASFLLFLIYQGYRFFLYGSGLLLFFIIFDGFLIVLTWLEYKRVRGVADYAIARNSPDIREVKKS